MVDTATFVSILDILGGSQLFNFSSDTKGYEFLKQNPLDLYDQEQRRVYIKDPPDGWVGDIQQIYSMKKEGDDSFKFTYGKESSGIYSSDGVVKTVILKMPKDETQRKILQKYFGDLVFFFGVDRADADTLKLFRFRF